MQMNQACRLVTISANHIMASVSAKFPVTASREFLENSHLCRTACIKQLNNTIFSQESEF